jgi:CBS domain-containing protein
VALPLDRNQEREKNMGYTLEQVRGMAVGDIMRSEVLAARANWSLETLADFLVDNNISGAPVTTQDDELVGVVSLTDIVRQSSMSNSHSDTGITHDVYLYELESQISREELRVFHTQEESTVRVSDIMTPMIFRVDRDTSLQEIAETMLKGRIHRVFVTEDGKLTGIVTALDMLQVIRDI